MTASMRSFDFASRCLSAAILGTLVFGLAVGALVLTRSSGDIALLWPANAVAVAWAAGCRRLPKPLTIAVATLSLAAANLAVNRVTPLIVLLPLIDAIEPENRRRD